MLKKILVILFFSLFSLLTFADDGIPTPQKTIQPLDTIVATVNSDIITQSDFDTALSFTKKQFKQRNLSLPSEKTLRQKVLQNLIDKKLQLQLAQQHGITVSNKDVEQRIQAIAQQNNVSVAQLKSQVIAEGMNYDSFKKQMRDQLLMEQVQRQMIQGSISVTKQEIADFRQQHSGDIKSDLFHVGDILIPVANVKDNAELSKGHSEALALMRSINGGTSVYDAVKKFSAVYNDLGWRKLSDLPSVFTTPIAGTKIKGISGPILAPNGYHVLYLIGRKSGISQLSDAQIQNILMQQKYEKAVNTSLDKIRQQAYIKINPDFE